MEIGGYFGLELNNGGHVFHHTPYRLNSGRSALSFLLEYLKPVKVYLPFYTCNALLEPFEKANIAYTFYKIDINFEIINPPHLFDKEIILYVDYYNIKDDYVKQLSERYNDRLIIDCTQAYFSIGNGKSWLFNSSRKFFGVPDGAYLYIPDGYNFVQAYEELVHHTEYTIDHLICRFNGETQRGYQSFQNNEVLNGKEVRKMSKLSEVLLSNINYDIAKEQRQRNFQFLHDKLKTLNSINLLDYGEYSPSFYPFLPSEYIDKKGFWDQQIYVPNFWNDCLGREGADDYATETYLSKTIIPIPIDHRYDTTDLAHVVETIKNL